MESKFKISIFNMIIGAIVVFGIIIIIYGFFVPNFQDHSGTVVDKWKNNHGFTLILNEFGTINEYSVSTDDYYKASIDDNTTINVTNFEGLITSICGFMFIIPVLFLHAMVSSHERDPWRD